MQILDGSKEKQRKFLETVELQIGLKAELPLPAAGVLGSKKGLD